NEIEVTNTLIRLQVDGGKEQPVDKFVRYKNNINEWYKDMENHGLNETEIGLMKEHLLERNGIMDTQEAIMLAVMDKRIGNSDLAFANKYRKAIAKKNEKAIEECEEIFTNNIINKCKNKKKKNGIINNQEEIMLAVIDKRIGNSDLAFANKYRKAIAKKNEKAIEECEEIFTNNIINNGHSKEFADYIINEQIGLSRKY